MIEQLGLEGLIRLDDGDSDIKDEFGCAGREAILGFDVIGGILRSLILRARFVRERSAFRGHERSSPV